MVQGRWFPMGSDIALPLSVREAVFGRGADALDQMAQQVIVHEDGVPVGSARLWWADGAFRLGDVGVLEDKRGRGFGDLLVRLLLFKALTHSAAVIRLECAQDVAPFFGKYGFIAEGDQDGAVQMYILGENVQLSHCGGNCAECSHQTEECIPKALR